LHLLQVRGEDDPDHPGAGLVETIAPERAGTGSSVRALAAGAARAPPLAAPPRFDGTHLDQDAARRHAACRLGTRAPNKPAPGHVVARICCWLLTFRPQRGEEAGMSG